MKVDINHILVLEEKATHGDWCTEGGLNLYVFTKDHSGLHDAMIAQMRGTGSGIDEEQQQNNAWFIAELRNNAKAMCHEIKTLREALGIAMNALNKLKSINTGEHYIPGVIQAIAEIEKLGDLG